MTEEDITLVLDTIRLAARRCSDNYPSLEALSNELERVINDIHREVGQDARPHRTP
jgi:hypothetical protein